MIRCQSREDVIKNIKLLGQELIDRAEELVGPDDSNATNFVLSIRYQPSEGLLPAIEITRQFYSKNTYDYRFELNYEGGEKK